MTGAAGPCRRSSSCSAGRRPSTTCRSCRARPSPTRWPRPATTSTQVLSTSTAAGGGCRPVTAAATARGAPTTTRRRSAPTGPLSVGAALDRLAAARPGAGRRHRPPRAVRRGRHDPGAARGGRPRVHRVGRRGLGASAWTRPCSSGCAAGIGLPVVDWREVRAARWASDRTRVRRELAAFAAGAGDPRLMVKPARLGSSVGMTLVHDPSELAAGARPRVPLRHAGPRRDVSRRARATSRSRSSATTRPGSRSTARARSSAATSSTTTPRSTRPACPRPHPRRGRPTRSGRSLHKISRDVYRAIGAEGFARIDFLLAGERIYLSEINTIPGFTPISLFPTLPAEGGYTFADVCERIVELALERHAARSRAPADRRGPAPVSGRMRGRPTARRARRARRRPAGRVPSDAPRPASRRSAPARRCACSSAPPRSTGSPPSPAFDYTDSRSRAPR